MRFPGSRKTKHYFPFNSEGRVPFEYSHENQSGNYIVGVDQLIVDIEVHVSEEFLVDNDIPKGESVVCPDDFVDGLISNFDESVTVAGEFAGGAIGNTLHNYSVLSDNRSVAFGTISKNISVGDYAFKYICSTNSHVDFSYLKPFPGKMGRALCLITPDNERSFVLSKGIMNELTEDYINEEIIERSSALLVSAFLLRAEESSLFKATMKSINVAKEKNIPVVLCLGTSSLVSEKKDFFLDLITNKVNILAGNLDEYKSLLGIDDPLLLLDKSLEIADLSLLTVGSRGLYVGGHCERESLRKTKDKIHSKTISEYNLYEYSRAMLKKDCDDPVRIYTHINPFLGGPELIKNTNGAGDAALSALLHDLAANDYHQEKCPTSAKHRFRCLTYSSIHQICKYCNRVSYEVLKQNSPRLSRGLPYKEDCLEEEYWAL
jgi:inosine kinase